MKLEPNMYVRTEYGISKIVNIFSEKTNTFIETENGLGNCSMSTRGKLYKGIYILEEDYKTFIDNNVKNTIIDLIEPGDLMYIDISPDNYGGIVVPRVTETKAELDKWKTKFASGECILKAVLTKEQIINNWYEVGE